MDAKAPTPGENGPSQVSIAGRLRVLVFAAAVAVVAGLTAWFWMQAVLPWTGRAVATGVSFILGPGVVGLIVALQIPPPRAERLGLRGFSPMFLGPVALLTPALVLGMELQALVRWVLGAERAAGVYECLPGLARTDSASGTLASLTLVVLIVPLTTEWFFRGVLQQRLVAHFGGAQGALLTSALSALWLAALPASVPDWLGAVAAGLGWAAVLGALREVSGSLAAPALLHVSQSTLWLAVALLSRQLPIPAFSSPGAHVPLPILAPAGALFAAGLALLARRVRRKKEKGR